MVTVRTEKSVELVFEDNSMQTGYGNVKMEARCLRDANVYELTIKRADPSFSLLLHFKTKSQELSGSLVQL